tara:strand:+ start:4541 stop:5377 length:837 start_codon:yes stop_codon:yes gene_type:complete
MYRLILENYIKSYLFEAFDENLRIKVSEALNEIVKNYSSEAREYDIFYDLVSVVDKFNMKHLGSGNSRKAYAIPGQDWVLKIAVGRSDKDEFERKMNAVEVEIGIGDHGSGPQNLFVELYDWDKLSVQPSWLIVQRVVPLYKAHKNMSIEDLSKVFPTFYNSLKDDSFLKKDKYLFCSFISDVISEISIEKKKGQNKGGLSEKDFYDLIFEEAYYDNKNQSKQFEEIRFYEDFRKISEACTFSRPEDIDWDSLGILFSENPKPSDFKILDYAMDPGEF